MSLFIQCLHAIGAWPGRSGCVPRSVTVVRRGSWRVDGTTSRPAAEFVQIVEELVSGSGKGRRPLAVLAMLKFVTRLLLFLLQVGWVGADLIYLRQGWHPLLPQGDRAWSTAHTQFHHARGREGFDPLVTFSFRLGAQDHDTPTVTALRDHPEVRVSPANWLNSTPLQLENTAMSAVLLVRVEDHKRIQRLGVDADLKSLASGPHYQDQAPLLRLAPREKAHRHSCLCVAHARQRETITSNHVDSSVILN